MPAVHAIRAHCYAELTVSSPALADSGGSKNFERGREDNLSAPSSFIANAYNEIYAFHAEKAAFWKKIWANGGAAAPIVPLFESSTGGRNHRKYSLHLPQRDGQAEQPG